MKNHLLMNNHHMAMKGHQLMRMKWMEEKIQQMKAEKMNNHKNNYGFLNLKYH